MSSDSSVSTYSLMMWSASSITAGAGDTAEHLIRLALLTCFLQQAGGPPQDVENVPVLTLQAHGGLFLLHKVPAQLIGDIVAQPGATKLRVGLQAPRGQFPPTSSLTRSKGTAGWSAPDAET